MQIKYFCHIISYPKKIRIGTAQTGSSNSAAYRTVSNFPAISIAAHDKCLNLRCVIEILSYKEEVFELTNFFVEDVVFAKKMTFLPNRLFFLAEQMYNG